jgi:RNA polymerase sigma-70 factor (ECF subfamily)
MTAPALHHDIVQRAQSADPQALAAIYERYAPGIFRYVYYRVGDPELAQDIQSDVFLRMLEGIGHYEDRGWSIASWLYRIAHARTVDSLRRAQRRPTTPLGDWDAAVEGPEAGLGRAEDNEALRRAIAQLSEGQRRVILLRHSYGLSLEETARQMGRTVGSVKALQHRAHERLASLIREEASEG